MAGRTTRVDYIDDAGAVWYFTVPQDLLGYGFQASTGAESRLYRPRTSTYRIPVEVRPRYVNAYVVNNNGTVRTKTLKIIIPDPSIIPALLIPKARLLSPGGDDPRGEIFYPTSLVGERRSIVPDLDVVNNGLLQPRQEYASA